MKPSHLTPVEFEKLILALVRSFDEVWAPKANKDGAVQYSRIQRAQDLPIGFQDEQTPGRYRLSASGAKSYFGYVVGPQSAKEFLFPPREALLRMKKSKGKGVAIQEFPDFEKKKIALIGLRGCDIAAMGILDRVFLGQRHQDPTYKARRKNLFVVGVNCTHSVSTCFCTSMGTGPRIQSGADLILTEVLAGEKHFFVAETSTDKGKHFLEKLEISVAASAEIGLATSKIEKTAERVSQNRGLNPIGIKEFLYQNITHSNWDQIAERCLACGNCTAVCPTCFCSSVEDVTDLQGKETDRVRKWDSCFTSEHSYIHGGSVHQSISSRYRQWMTHKLASWHDQFGSSGCTGCGRCVTWCPVGIDIREEIGKMREEI